MDTADCYDNEETVAQTVLKHTLSEPKQSTTPTIPTKFFQEVDYQTFKNNSNRPDDRRPIFVTGKVWVSDFTPEGIRGYVDHHLARFHRTSADLILLHWPGVHAKWGPAERMVDPRNRETRLICWKELEKNYAQKKCRAIGVSNYMAKHLRSLIEDIIKRRSDGDPLATIPHVNQIEIAPSCRPAEDLVEICREYNITITAYSTIRPRSSAPWPIKIQQFINESGKTEQQISLRWALQSGYCVIPRSSKPARAIDNMKIEDFELPDEVMCALNNMEQTERLCGDPHLIV